MHRREQFGRLLNRLGLTGVGVEVGVLRGEFSSEILAQWNGRILYLVDPWTQQPRAIYENVCNVPREMQEDNLLATQERLAPFAGRWELMRTSSALAAGQFAEDSLDLAQRQFNSYLANFAPGDFILHLPGMNTAQRIAIMRGTTGGAVSLPPPPGGRFRQRLRGVPQSASLVCAQRLVGSAGDGF